MFLHIESFNFNFNFSGLEQVITTLIADLPVQTNFTNTSHLERLYDTVQFSDNLININIDDLLTMNIQNIESAVRTIVRDYWNQIQTSGLGVSQIDDLLVIFVVCRLILLSIRYNILTAALITGISIFAAYLWYSGFIKMLFAYERALYQSSLTFRLAVDATQIKTILKSQTKANMGGYNIRLTNPVGILCYAIAKGSVFEGYRIDPLSMLVTRVPNLIKEPVVCWYYLIYIKFIPIAMNAIAYVGQFLMGVGLYTFVTRVNKRYCPYFIRWHWTNVTMIKFFDSYITYIDFRLAQYAYRTLHPKILKAREFNLRLPQVEMEMRLCISVTLAIILVHLSIWLYGLFHAVAGQYFYVPFFTENVELHIGPRPTDSIYSGGLTAWQDREEKPKLMFTKLWYGWFGRGTRKPNIIVVIIRHFIFRPIYKLIRRILKFIRRR